MHSEKGVPSVGNQIFKSLNIAHLVCIIYLSIRSDFTAEKDILRQITRQCTLFSNPYDRKQTNKLAAFFIYYHSYPNIK